MLKAVRKRTFRVLEKASGGDRLSRWVDLFLIALIMLNVVVVILETVAPLKSAYNVYFHYFDVISIAVFSLEYVLRVWACTENKRFRSPIFGRIRYMLTPMALVDLLAVLPFYLMFMSFDSRFLRALRLFRLIRLVKIGRYSKSFKTFGNVLKAKKEELVINLFVIMVLLVIASSLMYHLEHERQPQAFSSIPAAMWWGVATLTTVGYGDVYPMTVVGKLLGAVIAILGIGTVALPTGILASGFAEEMSRRGARSIRCPHCGKEPGTPSPFPSPLTQREGERKVSGDDG
ncbi:MAG: ion transporter [bacterium]|nr:ion transporter [bacterium]